jgi:hypothetical protein
MWNPDKTGILIDRGNGVLSFVESGPEFNALKNTAPDWHEAEMSKPPQPSIEEQREGMVCSPMQGMLALGETRWQVIQDYRDNDATWAEKVIIDRAGDWRRNSQNIAFFQHLLGMTDEEVDGLFKIAMEIEA